MTILNEIKARADKATAGPWALIEHANYSDIRAEGDLITGTIARIDTSWSHEDQEREMRANAAFIAAARTDVPALVLALEKTIITLGHLTKCYDIYKQRVMVKALKKELTAILTSGKGVQG